MHCFRLDGENPLVGGCAQDTALHARLYWLDEAMDQGGVEGRARAREGRAESGKQVGLMAVSNFIRRLAQMLDEKRR